MEEDLAILSITVPFEKIIRKLLTLLLIHENLQKVRIKTIMTKCTDRDTKSCIILLQIIYRFKKC